MGKVSENLKSISQKIPPYVKLIAVSKRQTNERIQEAYNAGHRSFGENLVQELISKKDLFPNDIEWHMIGHLQKNKVKYLVPFIHCIHSVDNIELLKEINKRAERINRPISCLFEIHIAKETSKFGLSPESLKKLLAENPLSEYPFVKIKGLMGMATNTKDRNTIKQEFRSLRILKDEIKKTYFFDNEDFKELSMGMSGDYIIAIDEGATMIRLGSVIFGERLPKI